ncbi:hypothetical protein BN946_scf184855.g3 [Trametes cinnabarina]|uniref:Uncharacterized protein n=1 Tax=Pycnoporus cinnabarinus TaxID=5643 RepID=A0A060SLY8_PYCCI|nr:hypothetical protein BN946_scf184855.g3 [Trametes cinnabarina]
MNAPSCIALLACKSTEESGEEKYLALILRPHHPRTRDLSDCFVGAMVGKLQDFMRTINISPSAREMMVSEHYYRTVWLSREQWETCLHACAVTEVYIPYRPAPEVYNMQRDSESHVLLYSLSVPRECANDAGGFELRLSKVSEDLLALNGYHPILRQAK